MLYIMPFVRKWEGIATHVTLQVPLGLSSFSPRVALCTSGLASSLSFNWAERHLLASGRNNCLYAFHIMSVPETFPGVFLGCFFIVSPFATGNHLFIFCFVNCFGNFCYKPLSSISILNNKRKW